MAKIIYALAGEGFGHASRAHLVGRRFLDAGHEVLFVSSHRALLYLRETFDSQVREIFGLTFDYHKGYVDPIGTIWKNLVQLPHGNRFNRVLFEEVYKPFRPDLVVTDFEPFSGWWAWRNRVPFISVNNEHMLVHCKLEHRLRNTIPRLTAGFVTRCHYMGARAYVVVNFFRTPLRKRTAVLAPPIVRPLVTELEPSNAGHILVYTTTGTHEQQWRDALARFPDERFVVYGFDKSAEWKNCTFKERSTEGFLADLAAARGVIASAGFSLISECLCLRKKMLLLPLAGQYEQLVNAQYAQMLGLGVWSMQLDEDALARFLKVVEGPMPQDDRILWPNNEVFFETLKGVLSRLDLPVRIAL